MIPLAATLPAMLPFEFWYITFWPVYVRKKRSAVRAERSNRTRLDNCVLLYVYTGELTRRARDFIR